MGLLGNAFNDLKGAVDPRNYVKAGGELIHHPLRFGKAVGEQYIHLAEHPIREFQHHPLNTLLELAPIAKVADIGSLGAAIARTGERGAAREALIRAAATDSKIHDTFGTLPTRSFMASKADGVARAQSASAVRRSMDEPTQWGVPHQPLDGKPTFAQPGLTGKGFERLGTKTFLDGEALPNDPNAYDRFMRNRAVEYYAKQPEYKAKPPVNEGPASLGQIANPNRSLHDFSVEGKAAMQNARPLPELGGLPLDKLLQMMEDAHARGNVDQGDAIASHIQAKHGFDPYVEEPPVNRAGHMPTSHPPHGAPSFMGKYTAKQGIVHGANEHAIPGHASSTNYARERLREMMQQKAKMKHVRQNLN